MVHYTFIKPITQKEANPSRIPSELEAECELKGITLEAVLVATPKDSAVWIDERGKYPTLNARKSAAWEDTAFHYSVTLKYKDKSARFEYKCGLGHCKHRQFISLGFVRFAPILPSAADVVNSCLMDSDACSMSFAQWCDELGYDTDSRQALKTYEACQENGDKLFSILPRELCVELRNFSH